MSKRIDLQEFIRNAIKARVRLSGDDRSVADLAAYGYVALYSPEAMRAVDQEVRALIASGEIVKVKGVYRVAEVPNA